MRTPKQTTPPIIVYIFVSFLIGALCATGYAVIEKGWLAWLGL